MLATFHDEQRKHLEDMIRAPANPFHVDVAKHLDPAEKLREVGAKLHSLREQGHHPLSVYDRFAQAGLLELYRTAYSYPCRPTTTSLRSSVGASGAWMKTSRLTF